ncbi:MAG: peroxiredoxin [Aquificaceae bacterium]|nr:peroxiredoxin [Aquificaceae bacterium]MDW8236861.1 peroxiredoxin [Aquificaceae bacterium]
MLEVGALAPSFCLDGISPSGESLRVCSQELKGKAFVLYFYPKDDTPGCTTEACDFRDNLNTLGIDVYGVSPDSIESHKKFIQKHSLNFVLLSDPDFEVAKAFGAYGKKKLYGKESEGIIRSTFVIDKEGKIALALYNVKAKGHVENLSKKVSQLSL